MGRIHMSEITPDKIDEYVESIEQEYTDRGREVPPRRLEHARRIAERVAEANQRRQERVAERDARRYGEPAE